MITIIDYGMGNTGSLSNMIMRVGGECRISSNPCDIDKADKLILPGVGSYDHAVDKLRELKLLDVLDNNVINKKKPILAICLGAQLVTRRSEEGQREGFGWIDAESIRFRFNPDNGLKIPHMGWNTVALKKNHFTFNDMFDEPRFYFVHSYHLVCHNADDILTTSEYGYIFVSSIQHDNIIATQFHPEKSHKYGLKLISNFVKFNHA